jgi:uncharacterized membrane protein YdbT with pleckstrin-like domain
MDFSKEQPLGRKALWYNLFTRCAPIIILFILGAVAFSSGLVSGPFDRLGAISGAAPAKLSAITGSFGLGFEGLMVLALVVIAGVTVLEYMTYRYSLDQYALKIKRGILSIQETSIPYTKIQDVDIDRPFIYRLFGISRIVILTAGKKDPENTGDDSSEGVLDMLDRDVAEAMKSELIKHASVQIVRQEA